MRTRRRLAETLLIALTGLWAAGHARAQVVDDVYPLEPEDGGVTGPKAILKVGVDGTDLGKMRFRIQMSRDGFETVDYTFDQLAEPSGWVYTALGGENGAIYRSRQPIKGGVYEWRAAAWNGVIWVAGKKVFKVRVDDVPPADVEHVRMRVDYEAKAVVLDWDPVSTDAQGGPERVASYHVYRYERKSFFFVIRPFEVGQVTDTHFEDRDEKALKVPLLFYKIVAEDEAGNEPERRY